MRQTILHLQFHLTDRWRAGARHKAVVFLVYGARGVAGCVTAVKNDASHLSEGKRGRGLFGAEADGRSGDDGGTISVGVPDWNRMFLQTFPSGRRLIGELHHTSRGDWRRSIWSNQHLAGRPASITLNVTCAARNLTRMFVAFWATPGCSRFPSNLDLEEFTSALLVGLLKGTSK